MIRSINTAVIGVFCLTAITGCGNSEKGSRATNGDTIAQAKVVIEEVAAPVVVAQGDKTWKYDNHVYTMEGTLTAEKYDRQATGVVTFTNIPADYREFEMLYTQFLGKTPHGTAALMPIAMEIYGRDTDLGEQCLRLINYDSNINSILSSLKHKLHASNNAQIDDGYLQRYLPAACLKGATPENGYNPTEPYTVEVSASSNKHQDMQFIGNGRIVYLYITGEGWDTPQRSIEIVKEPDSELHQVFNCPSLYSQCKQIEGEWEGLK